MAKHAYTTATLLPATDSERRALLATLQSRRSLLGADRDKTPGPVTLAIRGVRQNELPSWEIRERQIEEERKALRDLRKRIADQIEADIALLDAIDGDADFEPSMGSTEPYDWQGQQTWAVGSSDERENAQCIGDDGEAILFRPFYLSSIA